MATKAVPRAGLSALRATILRLENENVPALLKADRKGSPAGFERKIEKEDARVAGNILRFGIEALDDVLQGGLPLAGLTEIRAAQTRDAGAAMGFVLALAVLCQSGNPGQADLPAQTGLPVLWIGLGMASSEAGHPYGRGLEAYGLDTSRCIFSSPRTIVDALWIAEAALFAPVFAAIILEVRGNPEHFGLNESRRLHVRARTGKVPLFLLRQAGEEEASSAPFRFRVAPAPAAGRLLPDGSKSAGSIGNPAFRVAVEKSRVFAPLEFSMEWSSHARRFRHLVPGANTSEPKRRPAHSVADVSTSAGGSGGTDEMAGVMAFQKAS